MSSRIHVPASGPSCLRSDAIPSRPPLSRRRNTCRARSRRSSPSQPPCGEARVAAHQQPLPAARSRAAGAPGCCSGPGDQPARPRADPGRRGGSATAASVLRAASHRPRPDPAAGWRASMGAGTTPATTAIGRQPWHGVQVATGFHAPARAMDPAASPCTANLVSADTQGGRDRGGGSAAGSGQAGLEPDH